MNYNCPNTLDIENLSQYLKSLLLEYQKNNLRMNDIINHAESIKDYLWDKYGDKINFTFPKYFQDKYVAIPLKVLDYMEGLNPFFGILPRDVPYFVEFLDTSKGYEDNGWQNFEHYIERLNLEDRTQEEQKQGFYHFDKTLDIRTTKQ